MNDNAIAKANGAREAMPGTTTTEGFGTVTSTALAETAAAAVAAQAQAAVQARYIVAMQRPRDWDVVRERVLTECRRPRFAEVARYAKPVGGKDIIGPSIRFAEVALRCMGNVLPETATIYDDAKKRILRVSVTELESNLTYSLDVVVEKVVERSKPRDGVAPIAVRTNSYGKKTYLVDATEDDLLNKQASLVSKAIRQLALRLVPGDLLDEAMDLAVETQKTQDAKDPGAARKRVLDAFAAIRVKAAELKEYVGHDLDGLTPTEVSELRALKEAIVGGETTWLAATEERRKQRTADDAPMTAKDKVAAKAKEARAAKDSPKTEPAPAPSQHEAGTHDGQEPPDDYERQPGDDT